jgi:hypothetical protein
MGGRQAWCREEGGKGEEQRKAKQVVKLNVEQIRRIRTRYDTSETDIGLILIQYVG